MTTPILIGMFDSPFVRRAAISLDLLGVRFEHRNWSVGAQLDQILAYNPLGRVPVLVPEDGEPIVESAMVLDYLDDLVGPARALLPPSGTERRRAQKLVALAIGAVEKALAIASETVFRPAERRHPPYVERCRAQMRGGFAALERACEARGPAEWLCGDRIMQPDITLACVARYAEEAAHVDLSAWPALAARTARYEQLPVFRAYYAPFDAPVPT